MSAVLSFKYPPVNTNVRANQEQWMQATPLNGSVFRSDQNQSIILNLSSNSQFVKTTQSFLTGTITPRNADGSVADNTTRNTFQGVTRAFNRLVIRLGNQIVEDFSYSDLIAMYYPTLPVGRKSLLQKLEGFGNTSFLAGGAKKFAHLIMSSLFVTDQLLPLPLVAAGGLSIELFLAPASEIFTTANVSYYTVESPAYRYLAVTPDPAFTIGLRSAVSAGRSAFIAYQRIHSFPSNGNGSKTQQIVVPIGQVSSIASVETMFYSETDYADRTKDKYGRFINADLVDYRIEGAGLTNPSQITFKYEGGQDPEVVLMGLMSSAGNAYLIGDQVSLESDFETKSFRIGLNYESSTEYFGSGLSTVGAASPFLTIYTTHANVVPSTTRISTIVTTDALIEFRGSDIALSEVF